MARGGNKKLFKAISVAVPVALTVLIGFFIHKSRQPHTPPSPVPTLPELPTHDSVQANDRFFLYVLGGSTSKGEPFSVKDADPSVIGRLVSWHFDDEVLGRKIKLVTLAQKGTAIDVAAEMARNIADRKHASGTAAVLLYSGHNEFLDTDDHWDLTKTTRHLCDEWVVTPQRMKEILEKHRRLTEEIITTCKTADIPLVVSTLACNLRDWRPNRSVLANPANSNLVVTGYSDALKKIETGDFTAAQIQVDGLLTAEPKFAELHFLKGRIYEGLGETNAARQSYRASADFDGNPIRAVSALNQNIAALCDQHRIPLIDAPGIIARASTYNIPGTDLFYDWVHPTLAGYAIIAEEFAARLAVTLELKPARKPLSIEEARTMLGITDEKMAAAIARMAQICYVTATRRWDPEPRLDLGRSYLNRALELVPGNPDFIISQGMLELTAGNGEASIELLRKVYRAHPEMVEKRMNHPNVSQLFTRAGIPAPMARIKGQ